MLRGHGRVSRVFFSRVIAALLSGRRVGKIEGQSRDDTLERRHGG